MSKLDNNPILYPHQIQFLRLFFQSPFSKTFFLTGGTALSAFYLHHRYSQDLDLFSLKDFDTLLLRTTLSEIANKMNSKMTFHIRSESYNEIYLENRKSSWRQKIDIVKEQPKHFGQMSIIENITVDSLVNIASNKILAIFGRLDPKDYVDLYFILKKTELSFDKLFQLAKVKDGGLNEFYFANTIDDVKNLVTIPEMKVPFPKNKMVNFYQKLAKKLLLKIKPKK